MLLLTFLDSWTIDDGGMRILLFVLVLIAVGFILTGGGIALFTLYNQRKMQALPPEEVPEE